MMTRTLAGIAASPLLALVTASVSAQGVTPPVPQAVKGWREYPWRDGVVSIQKTKWRTDKIAVPVPAGKGLERCPCSIRL